MVFHLLGSCHTGHTFDETAKRAVSREPKATPERSGGRGPEARSNPATPTSSGKLFSPSRTALLAGNAANTNVYVAVSVEHVVVVDEAAEAIEKVAESGTVPVDGRRPKPMAA